MKSPRRAPVLFLRTNQRQSHIFESAAATHRRRQHLELLHRQRLDGWKKMRMKDWRAAARGWMQRAGQYSGKAAAPQSGEEFTDQLTRVANQSQVEIFQFWEESMTTNDVAKLLKLNKDMYQHSGCCARRWRSFVVKKMTLKKIFQNRLWNCRRCRPARRGGSPKPPCRRRTVRQCKVKSGTHFKGSARGKRKYVTVRPHIQRAPDGQTQGQHARNQNKAIFAALPLVAQEWLGSVRELSTLDTLDTTALNFKRKELKKSTPSTWTICHFARNF